MPCSVLCLAFPPALKAEPALGIITEGFSNKFGCCWNSYPGFPGKRGSVACLHTLYPLKSTAHVVSTEQHHGEDAEVNQRHLKAGEKKKEQKCTGSGVSALGLLWAAPGGTEGAELQRSGCGRALAAERGRGRVRAAAGLSLHRDQIQYEYCLLAASVSSPIPKFSDIRSNALLLRPERSLKHFQGQVMS